MVSKQVILKVNKNRDLIHEIGQYSRSKMYYKRDPGTSRPTNSIEVFFPATNSKPKAVVAVEKLQD
jgi:hypothetical protein